MWGQLLRNSLPSSGSVGVIETGFGLFPREREGHYSQREQLQQKPVEVRKQGERDGGCIIHIAQPRMIVQLVYCFTDKIVKPLDVCQSGVIIICVSLTRHELGYLFIDCGFKGICHFSESFLFESFIHFLWGCCTSYGFLGTLY